MTTQKNKSRQIVYDLLDFIQASPTPFHATKNLRQLFIANDFQPLDEKDSWQIDTGGNYVITRNDSSLIAIRLNDDLSQGVNIVGAHTDSPCLKVKPNPNQFENGIAQLGIEVYGGALLQPWLDRDLSMAGRVSGTDNKGALCHQLIDFKRAVAIAPNLAIHLNRDANKRASINPQLHLNIVLGQEEFDFKELLLRQCTQCMQEVLDYEISFYDTQPPSVIGLNDEFISSARLDNLLSSFVGAKALIDASPNTSALFVTNDHEEVGSASACGAKGPFLSSVLERLTQKLIDSSAETFEKLLANSLLISCDNAHAVHPNYADKHDKNHSPKINAGPVIKINTNQRYASNSVSSARFQQICQQHSIPTQQFVARADMACGSTIGPITATELGIETLDIGAPQWAMHSIRETAGTKDIEYLHQALTAFLKH